MHPSAIQGTREMSVTPSMVWKVPLLAISMIVPAIGTWIYFSSGASPGLSQVVYLITKLYTVVMPIIMAYVFNGKLELHRTHRPVRRGLALLTGLGVGLLMLGLILGTGETILGDILVSRVDRLKAQSVRLGIFGHFILFSLFLSIIHSWIEEFFWRGLIFGELKKEIGWRWAALISSLAFGLHHWVVTIEYFSWEWGIFFGFMVVIAGVIWCWIYEKYPTLIGPWVAHIFADLGIMWMGYQVLFPTGGLP